MGDMAFAATTQQPSWTPRPPPGEGATALARLAERLAAGPIPTAEANALAELAQGAPPDPQRLSFALAAIRSAIPRFSWAAVQAAQALVSLLDATAVELHRPVGRLETAATLAKSPCGDWI